MEPTTLGQLLRELRTCHGWTLRELSEALAGVDHPISMPSLSRLEHGLQKPSIDTLRAILDVTEAGPRSRSLALSLPTHAA